MATSGETCPPKNKRVRHEVRYQMELNFSSEADKKSFLRQLELVKSVMSSKESRPLDNQAPWIVIENGRYG